MEIKTEFYTTTPAGEEALIVVKTVQYPVGPALTLLRRGVDGRMTGGLQMLLSDLENELEDELCGSLYREPVAAQKKLVGKVPAEMNAYFN